MDRRRHDKTPVFDALSPAQQVARLQGVEHIAPLLFLVGRVIILATAGKRVQFLVLIVGDFLLAFALENLLAGSNRAYAAGLIHAAARGRLPQVVIAGPVGARVIVMAVKQPVDEPHYSAAHHQYRQQYQGRFHCRFSP